MRPDDTPDLKTGAEFMKHWASTILESLYSAANRLQMPFAILFLFFITNLPTSLANLQVGSFISLPIELLLIGLVLVMVGRKYFQFARLTATFALSSVFLLKLADIATREALARPFNPLFDAKLLFDGWIILTGTLGKAEAYAVVISALVGLILIMLLTYWSLGAWRQATVFRWRATLAAAVAIASAIIFFFPNNGLIEMRTAMFVFDRVTLVERSFRDRNTFEILLGVDPVPDIPADRRFNMLKGKDVIVIFIESYGETAIRDPRYSGRIDKRLAAIEQQISKAGLVSRSSWLLSPTSGGSSWLAHGTLLSGVWVDSQQRYDQLIGSKRPSLNALFREAGWRSVAVMPAITMDWPESAYFGYDAVYAANNLGYRGKSFNWVTMPDQYTLAAFQKFERAGLHRPVMAEIALISSHAPWTPVPNLIDWSDIGDGTVFNEQAAAGNSPEVVWQDRERVRTQYESSIDYVLETLGSYMARYGHNTVFILLGDHQPASIITGDNASRSVPVHFVTDDPSLLERLDAEKWTSGMIPGNQIAEPMDRFRQELISGFSSE
jgi:hypothetical protein